MNPNPSPSPVVRVQDIYRSFQQIHAVTGLSFELWPGKVVGFIGANGAGKTTTMRILATVDVADYGTVEITGYDVTKELSEVRPLIGWMPDSYGSYERVTVFEYLDFFARAYGFKGPERTRRLNDIIDFTDLGPLTERYMDSLSKGMKQRLCLGRALIHDPEVLILDEPAAGLDPKARVEFKRLVRLLAADGKALFISSHILSELEDMSDELLFIDAGRLVHRGGAAELKRQVQTKVEIDIRCLNPLKTLEDFLLLQPKVKITESFKDGFRIELEEREPKDAALLLKRLVLADFQVIDFHEHQQRLEDAFVSLLSQKNGEKNE